MRLPPLRLRLSFKPPRPSRMMVMSTRPSRNRESSRSSWPTKPSTRVVMMPGWVWGEDSGWEGEGAQAGGVV